MSEQTGFTSHVDQLTNHATNIVKYYSKLWLRIFVLYKEAILSLQAFIPFKNVYYKIIMENSQFIVQINVNFSEIICSPQMKYVAALSKENVSIWSIVNMVNKKKQI